MVVVSLSDVKMSDTVKTAFVCVVGCFCKRVNWEPFRQEGGGLRRQPGSNKKRVDDLVSALTCHSRTRCHGAREEVHGHEEPRECGIGFCMWAVHTARVAHRRMKNVGSDHRKCGTKTEETL